MEKFIEKLKTMERDYHESAKTLENEHALFKNQCIAESEAKKTWGKKKILNLSFMKK